MYAKGMSARDMEEQMRDIYGVDVSASLVRKGTDRVLPLVTEWQARPLETVYPMVFLDAIPFKVRKDHRIRNKAAYRVLGINVRGHKEVLGMWIGERESASFWGGVCNERRNRGVEDILIVCKDGLSGFSEAISSVFPKAQIQLCVIHQIRNSLKYVSHKNQKAFRIDLKKVSQAATLEEAAFALQEVKETWGSKYPIVIRSWENHWVELSAYFGYPPEIRRIIYTTNIVEAYHRQLRKATKTKTVFPTDDSLKKMLYLVTMDVTQKWTMPVHHWAHCISPFAILFGERLPMDIAL